MAESGNLIAGIFLPPGRMSTVKIRAGSLFRTPKARIGASAAAFHLSESGKIRTGERSIVLLEPLFLTPPQAARLLHRMYTGGPGLRLADSRLPGAQSKQIK